MKYSSKNFLLGAVFLLVILGIKPLLFAQQAPATPTNSSSAARQGVSFDLEPLLKVPELFPADTIKADGVQSFFYRGLDYKGRPTRVFAYYGVPSESKEKKFPAMVLIHGGGGTAFANWVKLWNSRGYAAIAMDLCGCIPVGTYGNWQRHDLGGPPGWDASFNQLNDPIQEQWTYQAISAVVLAHTLIRSYPEVDADRIGVTGISWGGYLTCIAAGVDRRFQFASPVYGCGYLGENSAWVPAFEKMEPAVSKLWLDQWDPSAYLPKVKMPMLWVNGTNDFAYPMDSWQRSYRLPSGPTTLCLRIRMPHGHGPAGENPEEIHIFANSILKQGKPLPKIVDQGFSNEEIWATFQSEEPIAKAELAYTLDSGKWSERKWESSAAEIDATTHRVRSRVPNGAKVIYLNLFDDRDCVVSTNHIER